MASLRRTKNFASDGQTPMFLYTILKQLDLRSIDWSLVASDLDISNGHAARMRYSRMRQQFEGLSKQPKQPKPPKAKKEKDGESKSSKDKAKGKRLLLEEENDRLAKERPSLHSDIKKARLDPSPYIDTSAHHSMMTTGQQYASSVWGQPMVKLEPLSGYPSLASNNTLGSGRVKKEPDTPAASTNNHSSSSLVVKREPSSIPMATDEVSAATPAVVKKEPDAVVPRSAFPPSNAFNSHSPTASYRVSNLAGPYTNSLDASHYMTAFPPAMGSNTTSSAYAMPQSARGYTYHPFLYQNDSPWAPQSIADYNVPISSIAPTADNMTLNPFASSYEELLNLPLYFRRPGTGPDDVHATGVHDVRHALTQPTDNNADHAPCGSRSGRVASLGTKDNHTNKASNVGPSANSTTAESLRDQRPTQISDAPSVATIDTDSDAECEVEVDADNLGMGDGNGQSEETGTAEPVEAW